MTSRRVAIIAAVAAVVVLGGGVVAAVSAQDDAGTSAADSGPTPAQLWREEVLLDFTPTKAALRGFVESLEGWTGKDEARANQARAALAGFLATRDALAERTALPAAPRALANYQAAAVLYVEAGRLATAGARLPGGDLQEQTRLTVKRLRALGDRVFDQAGVELAPHMQAGAVPDLGAARSAEVPLWSAIGLAPGEPLAGPLPVGGAIRGYEQVRPEQEFPAWAADVAKAGVPAVTDLVTTVADGPPARLRTLADALSEAADALYAVPDPAGERALSTRVQLGLLVQAEAVRVAQVAELAGGSTGSALTEVARTLLLVGTDFWDPRLGERDSGLPATLLRRPA